MVNSSYQYENLQKIQRVVAIGGGHGLGRLMSTLSFLGERLTGVVTTTDNGGSTGRIRHEQGGIAWGDLRNCLNQIITEPSTASALFEYRFGGNGALAGHNLGNLMLKALENLHVRPTEAVNLIRDLLRVKSFIYPMSEQPVHLAASLPNGEQIIGEVNVDNLAQLPASLFLTPDVTATPEAIQAIMQADLILIGPGSFLTSLMPPLLLPQIAQALTQSSAIKIFIDNLGVEHSPAAMLSLNDRIDWIHRTVGKSILQGVITATPQVNFQQNCKLWVRRLNAEDVIYRHDRTLLCEALDELVGELIK